MNARRLIAAAIALVGVGSIVHCGAAGDSADGGANPVFMATDAGDTARATAPEAGSNGVVFPGARDDSKGLILVHGSPNLPAFRLCFGTLSATGHLQGGSISEPPLPDRELMPDSNVVGVEIGSAVRLNPLADSHVDADAHVFAIPEVFVRPGMGPDYKCSARICPNGSASTCLPKDPPTGQVGYYDLGQLPAGATGTSVQLLVFHGCVLGQPADGGTPPSSCGMGFDPSIGNVKLDVVPLTAYKTDMADEFAVQIAQLSGSVVGTTLDVKYGVLGDPTRQQGLALGPDFGQIAPPDLPNVFQLDRTSPGIYASQGFQITVGPQVFAKSLAEIQLATAPQALPDDLYSSKSNFVLLLLGDPALSDAKGNALSPLTDPGLLLHLLVVPVGQPAASDAGIADAGGG